MGLGTTHRLALIAVLINPGLCVAGVADSDGIEFFESKIRPVLVEKCYRCHSVEAEAAGKLKGGLLLDSKEGLLQGGASGPAVVPGEIEESLILDALYYDFLQMPPEGKLADQVVADFEAWVKRGAPDPREGLAGTVGKAGIDIEAGRGHWAFQSPRAVDAPEVIDTSWPVTEIDRFILGRLEAEGIRPVAEADRRTLIRRLSFDLVGLPPSPEDVEAFLADDSPNSYEQLVDRLLASPHFGERWGRHWLDVARFGESLTLRGLIFKEAWRYRDFVIDALNRDLPYDQFLREQIAGDLLPARSLEDRRRQQIATGFLVLGNTNLEEQDKEQLRMDVVDEQIETLGKAVLAQTISCARCHDHKFDPIPTEDYYALAGILANAKAMNHANVSAWIEVPLPMEPDREAAIAAHEEAVQALEDRIKNVRQRVDANGTSRGVLSVADVPGIVVDDSEAGKVGQWNDSIYSGTYIGEGYLHDDNAGKGEKTLTFQPVIPEAGRYEVRLAYSHGGGRAAAVPVTILSADGDSDHTVNMREAPAIDGRFVSLGQFRFEANGQGYVQISNEGTQGHVTADAVVFLRADRLQQAVDEGDRSDSEDESLLASLEAGLKRLMSNAPQRDMALSVLEERTITNSRVHIRGSVHSLGAEVPRGFLRVADLGDTPTFPSDESGRRELAEWLASPQNPLTARVMVNRVWLWLFGEGLVRTVDNFGTTGEAPSHPELLDTLAERFVDNDWSIKSLVREMVLSRAYRLSTETSNPSAEAVDPENRLRWRMDRRRLDAECIRDAMLAASGRLDYRKGGATYPPELAADYDFEYLEERRSVYAPVFRNALPDVFEVFDFADPSMVVGRRDTSTVAPQALFFMNHPFVLDQSHFVAQRLLTQDSGSDRERVEWAYHLILGRPATDREQEIALDFLDSPENDQNSLWAELVQVLFSSIEFRYVH